MYLIDMNPQNTTLEVNGVVGIEKNKSRKNSLIFNALGVSIPFHILKQFIIILIITINP